MPDIEYATLDEAVRLIGREVTAECWEEGFYTRGQGGILSEVGSQVVLTWGGAVHQYARELFESDRWRISYEVALTAEQCIEFSPNCQGDVDYFSPDGRGSRPPRCAYHRQKRVERRTNSMEVYANCATPPAWFDPGYAGERWEED